MPRIAKANWYAIYREVQPLLEGYQGSGSINLLINKLAAEKQYNTKVLARMIQAGRFLDQYLGQMPTQEMKAGFAHIEQLQRLHRVAPKQANKLSSDVINGTITLMTLRGLHKQFIERGDNFDIAKRSKARSRIAEHDRRCLGALKQQSRELFGVSASQIRYVDRSDLLGQFYLVNNDGRKTAVFTRHGDTSRKAIKSAAELYLLARTAKDYFERICFIFPDYSEIALCMAEMVRGKPEIEAWLDVYMLKQGPLKASIYPVSSSTEPDEDLRNECKSVWCWQGKPISD
jgi:hypothetical protein